MNIEKLNYKSMTNKSKAIFLIIVSVILSIAAVIAVAGSEDKPGVAIIDKHFKQFGDVRYFECEVDEIDTAKLTEYVRANSVVNYSDYFLFRVKGQTSIWLEDINSIEEVNSAIYLSYPDLLINSTSMGIAIMDREYYK